MPYKSPSQCLLATITNSFIHTSVPSRSEENCCVQYTTGLTDGSLSWLLSSLVPVAEKAQGRNARWPPSLNLHYSDTCDSEPQSQSRFPLISTWALYSKPATPEKVFSRYLRCTTSSWTTNCYFWCWGNCQAQSLLTPKTSLTCSFDW